MKSTSRISPQRSPVRVLPEPDQQVKSSHPCFKVDVLLGRVFRKILCHFAVAARLNSGLILSISVLISVSSASLRILVAEIVFCQLASMMMS